MFKDKKDFDYFIYKAKKDGATNDNIYEVLVRYYNKSNKIKIPTYVERYIDDVEISEEFLNNEQFNISIKSLRSFYFGEQMSKQELYNLLDYLKHALWQVDKQITELIKLEE